MHTVELLLDPVLDAGVREVWGRLHEAGLKSLATHQHPTNRPHITLVVTESLEGLPGTGVPELGVPETVVPETVVPETVVPETVVPETVVPETGVPETGVPETGVPGLRLPVPVVLGPVRSLGRALVRSVDGPELRAVRAAVCEVVRPRFGTQEWVPHVSLALNMPVAQHAVALELLSGLEPVTGTCVAARSYDTETREVTALG